MLRIYWSIYWIVRPAERGLFESLSGQPVLGDHCHRVGVFDNDAFVPKVNNPNYNAIPIFPLTFTTLPMTSHS
jgi:hypothetical protein